MSVQTTSETSAHEQVLINIVRTLPMERVMQILDFARYVQSQTQEALDLLDEEDEETILADEARWDAQFAATQNELKIMAEEVRAEIYAGRTQPMVFTKDGRIAPG
jgi:uncharacterized protein YcaQ